MKKLYYAEYITDNGTREELRKEAVEKGINGLKPVRCRDEEAIIIRRSFTPVFIKHKNKYMHRCLIVAAEDDSIEDFVFKVVSENKQR